jgi:predicted DNA-binding transcriptional regulator AlpA
MEKYIKSPIVIALQNAQALSSQTLIRPREAAAILSNSRKHLYVLACQQDFPDKVSISNIVFAWIGCDQEDWIFNKLNIRHPITNGGDND